MNQALAGESLLPSVACKEIKHAHVSSICILPRIKKWKKEEKEILIFKIKQFDHSVSAPSAAETSSSFQPDEIAGVKYVDRDQLRELVRKADPDEDGMKLLPWRPLQYLVWILPSFQPYSALLLIFKENIILYTFYLDGL